MLKDKNAGWEARSDVSEVPASHNVALILFNNLGFHAPALIVASASLESHNSIATFLASHKQVIRESV